MPNNRINSNMNLTSSEYPCTVCKKEVKYWQNALVCDICSTEECEKWIHMKCQKLDRIGYEYHKKHPNAHLTCFSCISNNLPFSNLNQNEFFILNKDGVNFLKNDDNITYIPKIRDQLIFKKINQSINDKTQDINENDYDLEDVDTIKNCKYYGTEDFINAKFNNKETFSIFHLNIHSIELHIDELRIILKTLNFPFDFICITESKIIKDTDPKTDLSISDYQFPLNKGTESTKGGVMIYPKSGIEFKPRPDLNIYKPKELESVFLEVINPKGVNSVIGNIYRHPKMDANEFNEEYLKVLSRKLEKENKIKYIAGDFNLDLLKNNNHSQTSNFLDIMIFDNFR